MLVGSIFDHNWGVAETFFKKDFRIAALIVLLLYPISGKAADTSIRFGIPEEEYPPYLMTGEDNLYGIIADTFLAISKSMGIKTKLTIAPIKRLRIQIKNGELDAFPAAPEWEKDAVHGIETDGIIQVSDNLVVRRDNNIPIEGPTDLKGMNLALMQGYTYPSLKNMIENGTFQSIWAKQFISLLRMVEYGRVNVGVLDKNVANWVIRKNNLKFKEPIRFIEPGFDKVAYRIIFFPKNDKWMSFIKKFNHELKKFKKSPGWQKTLNHYR